MRRVGLAVLMLLAVSQPGGSGMHVVTCMLPDREIEVDGQPVGRSDSLGIIAYCVNEQPECVADSTGSLTVRVAPEGPGATCGERSR